MAHNKAKQNLEINNIEVDFDLEEIEGSLSKQLEDSFSDLAFLEREREMIANPDSLGKVVAEEVWKQFGNQIGLDITNETLIQRYDREHPEQYQDISRSIMNDKRYKEETEAMKKQQQAGKLKDAYTGKDLRRNEKANLDHVVTRKELFENERRKQASIDVAELANKKENLKPTNESLNKSKGAKSNKDYLTKREIREKTLIEQNKRANEKVDHSNMSAADKRLQKEINNKRLNDKLSAKDDLMLRADKEARKPINRDIRVGATKEIGKKAGKDALKTMAISALFRLLKEIMNGLIRFLKEKSKSFNRFLAEMKQSISRFFTNMQSVLQAGASALIGTVISEIFGPIVSVFKKLASLIKQGVHSIIDAVKYLTDKKNKDKPFSVKVAQVGKIITAGLVGGSALFLGEVFEKVLLAVPGMQTPIPLMGTLANMIGLFLASLVSGLIGAIVLNMIDKFISKKLEEENDHEVISKKNKIINLQDKQLFVAENRVSVSRINVINEISANHKMAKEVMQRSLENIMPGAESTQTNQTNMTSENQSDLAKMQQDLAELL